MSYAHDVSWLIERRLKGVTQKLRRAREDLAVADEQLLHFAEESDDARLRSIVSDDRTAGADASDAQRHTDAMRRHRADLVETIERLERTQDELLDQLSARRSS